MKSLKNISAMLLFIIFSFQILYAQDNDKIKGSWLGILKISGIELRVVFRVTENENGSFNAMLDSPDQGAYDIAVDSVIFVDPYVKFVIASITGFYEGNFEQDSITGTWNQAGSSFSLVLKKTDNVEPPKRPQEPKPPFPYSEEEVFFENKEAGLTLAGTFTYPFASGEKDNSFPAVVLISGSGPQNRDEELLGHKPFLVLADHLTRNGIAVLRFDDRGVGKSTGDFSSATTEDFVTDALAGVEFLMTRKEVDKNNIGLIGHSEGGLVAPLAAVQSDDVSFIVLLAGTGIPGKEILRLQTELIMRANGTDEETIARDVNSSMVIYGILINEKDSITAREMIKAEFDRSLSEISEEEKNRMGDPDQYFNLQANILLSPWFRFFLKYDPYPILTKVRVPVLAIIGEKDLQVPPKENLEMIKKALKEGGNKNYKVEELPGLNHLFQNAETGSPNEYAKIEGTFSPGALDIISDWIKEIVK
jgi:pimeloyl-ACP methyl ester carboxylesterase